MSEVEQVFGKLPDDQLEAMHQAIAKLRNNFGNILERFADSNSYASEPMCVLYGIYKAMERLDKIENGFILAGTFDDPHCDQAFHNKNNELLVFDSLEEAIKVNEQDCYYGIITYLGN